jgi:hypothetical protein
MKPRLNQPKKWLVAAAMLCGCVTIGIAAAPSVARLIEVPRYRVVSPERENGKGHVRPWSEMVGSQVQVEGITWGAFVKGYDPYVIAENGNIYVPRALDGKEAWNGRPVRVTGRLGSQTIRAAAAGPVVSQGPANDVFFYTIEDAKVELIEQVKWPWLQVIEMK